MVQRVRVNSDGLNAKVFADAHVHLIYRKAFIQLVPVTIVVQGENIVCLESTVIVSAKRTGKITAISCQVKKIERETSKFFKVHPPIVIGVAFTHFSKSNPSYFLARQVGNGPTVIARHIVRCQLNAHQRSRGFLAQIHGC